MALDAQILDHSSVQIHGPHGQQSAVASGTFQRIPFFDGDLLHVICPRNAVHYVRLEGDPLVPEGPRKDMLVELTHCLTLA